MCVCVCVFGLWITMLNIIISPQNAAMKICEEMSQNASVSAYF